MSETNGYVQCSCCDHKQRINMLFVDLNMTGNSGKEYRIYCTKCKNAILFNKEDVKTELEMAKDFIEELTTKKHSCIVCGDEIKHIEEIRKERCFDCQKCSECGNQLTMHELSIGADYCAECSDDYFWEDLDEGETDEEFANSLKDEVVEEEIIETEVDPTAPMWKQALQKYGMA